MQVIKEVGWVTPVSKPHLLEYVAHLSYELARLAQDAKLDFIAYLLNIIHLESSKEMGQYPLETSGLSEHIPQHFSPHDLGLYILNFSETMAHVSEKNGMNFMAYLFSILHAETQMGLNQPKEAA